MNSPPQTPGIPTGPKRGTTRGTYMYTTTTTDPEGYPVYYQFSWGDGTYSGWLGPYPSGENVSASHQWTRSGIYQVKVKARDTRDVESAWSKSLLVRISDVQLEGKIISTG